MTRVIDWYFKLLKIAIFTCLAMMVLLVFGNVVLRYAFNSGITFSEEFARWLFVWLTFFGAIIGMRDHTHLGMDSVVSRLPAWAKKACYVLSHLLMILCVVLLLAGGWDQTLINIYVKAPATGFSTALFYGIVLIFGISAIGILLSDLYQMLTGQLKDEDLIQIKESEEEVEIEEFKHEKEHESAHGVTAKVER